MPDELPEGLRYSLDVEGPVYQEDEGGQLRRIDGGQLDPTRPFFLIPDEDAVHDQGDEHCEDCDGELTMEGCDCEPGEWIEMGYTEDGATSERVAAAAASLMRSVEESAPAIRSALTQIGEAASRAVDGIRVAVERAEWTSEGLQVTARLPDEVEFPPGISASLACPGNVSDNGSYVVSPNARQPVYARRDTGIPAVSVASPTVNGLGREQIINRQLDLAAFQPGYVQIPEELGGLPEDAPERLRPRMNRADRRRAKKRRG